MQKLLVIFLFALVPFYANSQNAKNEKDSLLLLLQKTFLVIKQNSVYKSAIDWDSLKAQVLRCAPAQIFRWNFFLQNYQPAQTPYQLGRNMLL